MADLSQDGFEFNDSPPFTDVNLFTSDLALQAAVRREGAKGAVSALKNFGAVAGSQAAADLRWRANTNTPALRSVDALGRRVDWVDYDPAYHALMSISTEHGLHCSTWEHVLNDEPPRPGAHAARAAGMYMAAQMEPGHCCPITMTHASVAALRHVTALAKEWIPMIARRQYDPEPVPSGSKKAVTLGMGMTERQGGSDVRTNQTFAERTGDGVYRLTGHKWFFSAPMSDAFLVLAQAKGGLSCFLVTRLNADGTSNGMRLVRLKDKLGNRSNASSEVEFEKARGLLVGEEGRGVRTIIDMVTLTRLDCAVSSAGLMRQALARAQHHARYRTVFQRHLIDQPLMARVLADMALDSEAAVALSLRLARALDGVRDEEEAAYLRLMTPVTKFWVCKTAPSLVGEAMECMGGNGYVEEGGFPLLYREVPVNAIWEGASNVICLDVVRILEREPEALRVVLDNIASACGGDVRIAAELSQIEALSAEARRDPGYARALVERLALVQAASLLLGDAPVAISDGFMALRFGDALRRSYGASDAKVDARAILDRSAAGNP